MLPGTCQQTEIESPFSGMVMTSKMCNGAIQRTTHLKKWIVDSGATDHMTSTLSLLSNVKVASAQHNIKLPTGDVAVISHIRDLQLQNGLKLLGVLFVPTFHHNLISIHKLAQDNNCNMMFPPDKCLILDSKSQVVKGAGILKEGLYYLTDDTEFTTAGRCNHTMKESFDVWHNRLRHAPEAKMKLIPTVKSQLACVSDKVCLTCPMARFTQLPLPLSQSHAKAIFDLVHADIWGPYKVNTR